MHHPEHSGSKKEAITHAFSRSQGYARSLPCSYSTSETSSHNWSVVTPATCSTVGSKKCTTSGCGQTANIDRLGCDYTYSYVNYNSTYHQYVGKCKNCGGGSTSYYSHTWTTTKAATCTTSGTKQCTTCNRTESFTRSHVLGSYVSEGSSSTKHYRSCTYSDCPYDVTETCSISTASGTATQYNSSYHKTPCLYCGDTRLGSHKFTSTTSGSTTTYKCGPCGYSYTESAECSHNWGWCGTNHSVAYWFGGHGSKSSHCWQCGSTVQNGCGCTTRIVACAICTKCYADGGSWCYVHNSNGSWGSFYTNVGKCP